MILFQPEIAIFQSIDVLFIRYLVAKVDEVDVSGGPCYDVDDDDDFFFVFEPFEIVVRLALSVRLALLLGIAFRLGVGMHQCFWLIVDFKLFELNTHLITLL